LLLPPCLLIMAVQQWEETVVIDHGRGQELLVKKALHIQMTPSESASTDMENRKSLDAGLL